MPDPERSLQEGAISPWGTGQTADYFLRLLTALGEALGFRMDTPWEQLPARAQKAILYGHDSQVHVRYRTGTAASGPTTPRTRAWCRSWSGGTRRPTRDYSREKYEGYMREVPCPACGGARLKPEVLAVTLGGKSIAEVSGLSIGEAGGFLADLRAVRAGADDRRAGAQGGPRPAGLPGRRRAGLPLPGPAGGDAGRRRGAADPAGHPDRLRPGRRALRAGRAVHRAAPAGQPAADRDAGPAPRPRQHADRGRARRGHHPGRRLGGGHRPGRRGARRPGGRLRHRGRPAGQRELGDRGVPVRPPTDPAPDGAAARGCRAAS